MSSAVPATLMLRNGLHDITGEKIRTCLLNSGIMLYSVNSILLNGNFNLFSLGWLASSVYEMSFSCQYIVYFNPTSECANAVKGLAGEFVTDLKNAIFNRDIIEIGKNLYSLRNTLKEVNVKCVDLNRNDFFAEIKKDQEVKQSSEIPEKF